MKIAMLLDNPFTNDRRVHREAKELASNGYQVTIFCLKKKSLPDEEIIDGFAVKRIFPEEITKFSSEKIVREIAIEC